MLMIMPRRNEDEQRDQVAHVSAALAPPPWPRRVEARFAELAELRAGRAEMAAREKAAIAENLELDRTSPTIELRRATEDLHRRDAEIAATSQALREDMQAWGPGFLASVGPGVGEFDDAVAEYLNQLEQLADSALKLHAFATRHELPVPRSIARAPALLQFVREFRRTIKSN